MMAEGRGSLGKPTRVAFLVSAVVTIVFLISYVFSDRGISQLQRAQQRVHSLEEDVERLRDENAKLREQLRDLDESTFPIEAIAREDLGLARPGETVYLLREQPSEVSN